MAKQPTATDNVISLHKWVQPQDSGRPYLSEDEDARLGDVAAAELRKVLDQQIELASLRWARDGNLLAIGEPPSPKDAPVFSASEACARVALQEAVRAVFWECGEPIPKEDMPVRIVRLQEEFNESLRRVLNDLGYT